MFYIKFVFLVFNYCKYFKTNFNFTVIIFTNIITLIVVLIPNDAPLNYKYFVEIVLKNKNKCCFFFRGVLFFL